MVRTPLLRLSRLEASFRPRLLRFRAVFPIRATDNGTVYIHYVCPAVKSITIYL